MAIYVNGKLVAGKGGDTSGGVDIPVSDIAPEEGNFWLDTSEDSGEYTSVNSFNGRVGRVLPQNGDYTAEMVGARPDTWLPTAEDVGAAPKGYGIGVYNVEVMLATNWNGKLYSFEEKYPAKDYDTSIEVAPTATVEQFRAFGEAMICGSHDGNIATAVGDVPTVDIPIIIKAVKK